MAMVTTSVISILILSMMSVGILKGQDAERSAINIQVSYNNGFMATNPCFHSFTANYTAISVVTIYLNNPRNWAPCYCVFYERDNRPLNHLQVVVRNEGMSKWFIHRRLEYGMWHSTSVGLPYFRIDNIGSESVIYTPGYNYTETYTSRNSDYIFDVADGQQLIMHLWCSPHGFHGGSTESPDTATTTPVTTTSTTTQSTQPSFSISPSISPSLLPSPTTSSPTPAHNNTTSTTITGSSNTVQNSMHIIIGAVIGGVVVFIVISVVIIITLVPIRKQRSKRENQDRTSGNSDTTESVRFNNNQATYSEGIAPHHTPTEKNKTLVENSSENEAEQSNENEAEQIQYAGINIGLLAPKQPAPSTEDKTLNYAVLPFHTSPVSGNIPPPGGKSAIANPQPDKQTQVQELYATVDKVNNNRFVPAQGKQKPKVMKSTPIAGEKSEQSQSTGGGPVTYENLADTRRPLAQVSPVVRGGDNGSYPQVEYANVLQ